MNKRSFKTMMATIPSSPSAAASAMAPPYCGTQEGSKCWYNTMDPSAMVLSGAVWAMLLFSMIVCIKLILLEADGPDVNNYNAYGVIFLCFMGLYSHAACMLSDPGVVPSDAKPLPQQSSSFVSYSKDELLDDYLSSGKGNDVIDNYCNSDSISSSNRNGSGIDFIGNLNNQSNSSSGLTKPVDEESQFEETSHVMCGICDSYKPPFAHHDRMSGRCVSRMDHFCPWTNNAIGAKNQKSFILFVAYTNLATWLFGVILLINRLSCSSVSCSQDPRHETILHLQMIVLVFSAVFTTSMWVAQIYSLMTGIGTIDRMQMRKSQADSFQAIPFKHVFGDEAPYYHRWFLPTEPKFDNPEAVLLYRRTSGW